MKKFFAQLIGAILKYLIVLSVLIFASFCFITQSFPPNYAEVKVHLNNLRNASANYAELLNKSHRLAEKIGLDEEYLASSTHEASATRPAGPTALAAETSQNTEDINFLKMQILKLQSRIEKLEEQNANLQKKLSK